MTRVLNNPEHRTARLVVANEYGLHIRAAIMLARLAEAINAQLTIACGRHRVSGDSVMGLVALGAARGTSIHAIADGTEAGRMIRAVRTLFKIRFYENYAPRQKSPDAHRPVARTLTPPATDRLIVQGILGNAPASAPAPAVKSAG